MVEQKIEIVNRLGLHARAAAKLVHAAGRYASDVAVVKDGEVVDAKSILGILQLGAAQGSLVTVRCSGSDEIDALAAVVELIDGKFGEES